MNDQPDQLSLDAHLDAQAEYLTDRCTLCGTHCPEDSREFIEANKLDMSSLREVLPPLMEGKDKGLSLW